jgi:putative transposase
MRPSKFSEEQIVEALRQVSTGTPAVQVCRSLGITETTFYRWRRNHEGGPAGGAHEVRALREENHRLKELVANLLLAQPGVISTRRRP